MIKVLHIVPGLSVGGAEMMLLKLVSASDKSRFDHHVLSLRGYDALGGEMERAGAQLHCLSMKAGEVSISGVVRLMRLVRTLRPNILQGWMYHGNLAASFCKLFAPSRAKTIWNIRHGVDGVTPLKAGTARVARLGGRLPVKPSVIINNSRRSAELHSRLGYPLDRSVIIPNGFDCDRFKPSRKSHEQMHMALGVPEASMLVGIVGRYHPDKNYDSFIAAAVQIARKCSTVHFVLVGNGIDADNELLTTQIRQSGFADRFHLLGMRNDVHDLMPAFNVFCSSSIQEGFSNVIGEAMACAVPCVATDVGDSAWIVNGAGIVVPPRDVGALADGLMEMLNMPEAKRREMGNQARQRVLEHFSLQNIVAQYESLYENLVRQ